MKSDEANEKVSGKKSVLNFERFSVDYSAMIKNNYTGDFIKISEDPDNVRMLDIKTSAGGEILLPAESSLLLAREIFAFYFRRYLKDETEFEQVEALLSELLEEFHLC